MSKLPNLNDLKSINDFLEQIQRLKQELEKIKSEKVEKEKTFTKMSQEMRERLLSEGKKLIINQYIEQKIVELRDLEVNLRRQFEENLEHSLNNFLNTGGLKQVIEEILNSLKKQKIEYQILVSSGNLKFLPKNELYQTYDGDVLRIVTEFKDYVLDVHNLKNYLKKNLLNSKLPQAVSGS